MSSVSFGLGGGGVSVSRNFRVSRSVWVDKRTQERNDVIAIRAGSREVKIPFDVARQVVDKVHDLCDARDTELREASHDH